MWLPTGKEYEDFLTEFLGVCDTYYAGRMDDAAWTSWYDRRLPEVVRHVQARSPFYGRHLAGVDGAAVSTANLARLPFTTKDDLRREMFDVLSGDVSDAIFFYETTGTTGRATPCPRDGAEIIASNTHVTESWKSIFRHHFGDRRPAVGLMGPTEVHSFGDTLGDVARNVGSCNAKIWPYSPVIGFAKALQLMKDLKLEVIVCTPGVALNLAKAAVHYGYDLHRDFAVKLFFVTGEMCTPALAANIDSVWGVDTYNILYGSQEAFVIGTTCRNKNMHLSAPNYVAEIIDPDTGASLGGAGTGELCVTTLVTGVKPLVRYRTGDLVRLGEGSCDCELKGPRLDVVGRVLDRIELGGGRHLASEIEEAVLTGVTGCLGFQVIIEHDSYGADSVTIRLDLMSGDAAGIPGRFAERFGVAATVEVVTELDQITSTGAFVSWKAARIKDLRTAPDHEAQVAAALGARRGYTT
ncbi:phenylacetate--CoA ligase family protein [Spirilliplanes yamanashiensis]|uniref:Phenylacetate-coenzyme A ligase n=1 Tax=Spirilliplanes yamanashiensis TaxID=42233 RepID=A0A8J3Y5W4_9ACTN|nr:phenylacetate--CoA ligase family protein [Spirilliplanes yamanashiensis]MDP9819292.1 phenylacetate-CoA ligase [Spirilliplanes yamanashiensis]GIJ01885.1 phenylacetate-coenzyme A ligase [Spirilliplanes yamanashiensis]